MNELKFKKSEKIKAVKWLDSIIDSLDDKAAYTIKLEKTKKKRSLSANAYFWGLVDAIAEKTAVSKEEIYKSYIRNVGGNTEILRVEDRAVKALERVWTANGLGWQMETSPSGYDGWTDCILYYGSSRFDSATMARLINLAEQDCLSLEIPTLGGMEVERMVNEWEKQYLGE